MNIAKMSALALLGALMLCPPARSTDLVVDGNAVVGGKVGIGLATNAVPAKALEILNGSIALRQTSTTSALRFENGSLSNTGFTVEYRNGFDDMLIRPLAQASSYWPNYCVWMNNQGKLGAGTSAPPGRLGVSQLPSDTYGLSITSHADFPTIQPNFGWFKGGQIAFTQRLATTSLNQIQFNISPALGQPPVTALEIHPSTNVLIGANVVPAAKLHVVGNIIAADPTAGDHDVTKQWLEAGHWRIQPQGDISMGEFTEEP